MSTKRSYIHKKTCLQVCITFFQTPGVKRIIMPDGRPWLCANPRHFFWLPLVPWRSNSSPSLFQSCTVNLILVSLLIIREIPIQKYFFWQPGIEPLIFLRDFPHNYPATFFKKYISLVLILRHPNFHLFIDFTECFSFYQNFNVEVS